MDIGNFVCMLRKWILAPKLSDDARKTYPELPEVVLNLLWNRGLKNQEKIDEFLNPDYGKDIHDPFLFRDMEKAVGRIFEAIKNNEKIAIHGDYDADGVSGAVILYETLMMLGCHAERGCQEVGTLSVPKTTLSVVDVFLPHRETDGYGINSNTIKNFSKDGVNLVVTCDCGISNAKQIEEANDFGIDVIITDHHEVPKEIPDAFAIIHPKLSGKDILPSPFGRSPAGRHLTSPSRGEGEGGGGGVGVYPWKELSGGAVAWKLACGLIKKSAEHGFNFPEGIEKWFLDLVAISLIADVIPLLGEARTLAKYGLVVLNKTRRLGLKSLFEAAGIKADKIEAWSVGYIIAPRINAAGRMNHASAAFNLLISQDAAEAKKLATKLNQSNSERQKQTEVILLEAKGQIVAKEMDKKYALAAFKEDWPLGLLGLVSGKIAETFYRPAIVCSLKDGKIVGSGRSGIAEFNLLASLEVFSDYFERSGGHKGACGFVFKDGINFEEFYKKWNEECKKRLEGVDLTPVLCVDSELDLDDIDWRLYDTLFKLEPFGEGNTAPRYLAKGVTVCGVDPVGASGKHLRFLVCHKGVTKKKMIGFSLGPKQNGNGNGINWCEKLKMGDKIDVVFEVGVNEWNGNREIQLKVIDLKMSS